MSQPPLPPAPGVVGGPVPPQAVPPQPAVPPPAAAPTQIAFPGQVQLPPQPQYAPAPQQVPPVAVATGFPLYRSPAPTPRRWTKEIVTAVVILVTVIFAVVGFWLVA